MNRRLLVSMIAAAALPVFAADNLDAVLKQMRKPDPAPIKAYLAEHPDAPDADKAERMLAALYSMTKQHAEAIKIFEARYEKMLAKKDELKTRYIKDSIRDLLDACGDAGERERLRTMIARVEKDFAGHKDKEYILDALRLPRDALKMPLVGETMEIKFTALDGREVDLAAMKGKVVLVEYWATWCGPCVAELPTIKKVYGKYHDQGFEIVSISLDEDKAALESFVKKQELPWPQAFMPGIEDHWKQPLVAKFGIHAVPTLFLIGKDGKVAAVNPRGPGVLEKSVAAKMAK